MSIIVTIDGRSGCSKSTIGRELAGRLNALHISSGNIFRALTWILQQEGLLELLDSIEAREIVKEADLEAATDSRAFLCNGIELFTQLRAPSITSDVSRVAACPWVREKVYYFLHSLVKRGEDLVVDGRDMGSRVFADAAHKFFFDATLQERIQLAVTLGKDRDIIMSELVRLDKVDAQSPLPSLHLAPDAIRVASLQHSRSVIIERLLAIIRNDWRGMAGENGRIQGRLASALDPSSGEILVAPRPTFHNVAALMSARGAVFLESLPPQDHAVLLFKESRVPHVSNMNSGAVSSLASLIGEEVTLVTHREDLGFLYPYTVPGPAMLPIYPKIEHGCCSNIPGMQYLRECGAKTCMIRGDFCMWPILAEQPAAMVSTESALSVRNHLQETLRMADLWFPTPIYRFSDWSDDMMAGWNPEGHSNSAANPALGERGVSLLLGSNRPLFLFELEMLSTGSLDRVQVLLPYVRTVDEAKEAVLLIRKYVNRRIGCMIETPLMLAKGKQLDNLFDFFVIGTSDLLQLLEGRERSLAPPHTDAVAYAGEMLAEIFIPDVDPRKEVYVPCPIIHSFLSAAHPGRRILHLCK